MKDFIKDNINLLLKEIYVYFVNKGFDISIRQKYIYF